MPSKRETESRTTKAEDPAGGIPLGPADAFIRLAEALTGTPVKDATHEDRSALSTILSHSERKIDRSQLNEMLLLVNKDRLTKAFFDHFFGNDCSIGSLPSCVEKFQKTAMRRYGNFIFAYRKLSRIADRDELLRELEDVAATPVDLRQEFEARVPPLIEIKLIPRDETYLVGYLSAAGITADLGTTAFLLKILASTRKTTSWKQLSREVDRAAQEHARPDLRRVLASFQRRHAGGSVAQFRGYLRKANRHFKGLSSRLHEIQEQARINQNIYLTWDHMDVYFATSMRKRWEFEELHDFVANVMGRSQFKGVRHFDPTQAYMSSRIDKGLVESLMLKRARCTVYMVQDTDTLGKDSELAATLAQGKPVIAYVPKVTEEERAAALRGGDLSMVHDRLRFVRFVDDAFDSSLDEEAVAHRMWRTTSDELRDVTAAEHDWLNGLCKKIAAAEVRMYERRARTLTESHPLALQVNLQTGVANGVLVVRTADQCAELLAKILHNELEFDLKDEEGMWLLSERISGSVFRAVSKNRRLTNCFWNFYKGPDAIRP